MHDIIVGIETMKIIKVNVRGMTCVSCEVLLERSMKKVSGVHNVQVSMAKELAVIHCDQNVKLEDLQAAVSNNGYQLIPSDSIEAISSVPFIVGNKKRYAEIGAVFLFIMGIYLVLTSFDLLPKSLGVTDNMSYGFVFVIGLIAATSTCLAVAGGLLLAVANRYNTANGNLSGMQKFKPHVWFNIGRIAVYVVLGGVIGAVGSMLSISPKVTGIITILASLLMIIMGVQLLQVFPWMNKIELKMPKFIAHKIYDASHKEGRKTPGKWSSFFFGGSTFFLPCGFTQALQLYVLGRGDFMTGALVMLAFSLGTLPALVGIGVFTSFAKGRAQKYFTTFSAVLVIILGIFAMPSGITLFELGSDASLSVDSSLVSVNSVEQVQSINLEIRGLDYYPSSFRLKRGVPVEWNIDGRGAVGCARVISVPALGIQESLPSNGIKTIRFTPTKIGKIKFSCSMGMAGPGTFEVV
jgi:uncharacterized protein